MIIMRVIENIDEQLMTAQYKSHMADGRPSKGQLSFFSEKAARTRMATTANATGKTLFTLKPPIERLYYYMTKIGKVTTAFCSVPCVTLLTVGP